MQRRSIMTFFCSICVLISLLLVEFCWVGPRAVSLSVVILLCILLPMQSYGCGCLNGTVCMNEAEILLLLKVLNHQRYPSTTNSAKYQGLIHIDTLWELLNQSILQIGCTKQIRIQEVEAQTRLIPLSPCSKSALLGIHGNIAASVGSTAKNFRANQLNAIFSGKWI